MEEMKETYVILGLGRSPQSRNGNSLQYSCWENSWTEKPEGIQSGGNKELDMNEHTCKKKKKILTG